MHHLSVGSNNNNNKSRQAATKQASKRPSNERHEPSSSSRKRGGAEEAKDVTEKCTRHTLAGAWPSICIKKVAVEEEEPGVEMRWHPRSDGRGRRRRRERGFLQPWSRPHCRHQCSARATERAGREGADQRWASAWIKY